MLKLKIVSGLVYKLSKLKAKRRLFLFAGQGTQEKGMLDKLLSIPEAKG